MAMHSIPLRLYSVILGSKLKILHVLPSAGTIGLSRLINKMSKAKRKKESISFIGILITGTRSTDILPLYCIEALYTNISRPICGQTNKNAYPAV